MTKSDTLKIETSRLMPKSDSSPSYVYAATAEQDATQNAERAKEIVRALASQLPRRLLPETCHFLHVGVFSGSDGSSLPSHLTIHGSSGGLLGTSDCCRFCPSTPLSARSRRSRSEPTNCVGSGRER